MAGKAQSASAAATLIALIGGFILLYLLFLSPEMRDQLLYGTGTGTGTTPGSETPAKIINKTIMTETPGRIDFLRFKEYEHPLPAVNLYTVTNAEEMTLAGSLQVKNGIFDRHDSQQNFSIDIANIDEPKLSIRAVKAAGILTIVLNGNAIFSGVLSPGMSKDIELPQLQSQNTLRFSVSDVGWKFWTTNEYMLDEVKLFYDSIDVSQQRSRNVFNVESTEKFNIASASLKFFPDCTPASVGVLKVEVNGQDIMTGVPDCGQLNMIEFSPQYIVAGENRVIFTAERGKYFIDQIVVKTRMKPMVYPVYYFDLPSSLFMTQETDDDDEECGDVDGVCPNNCDRDVDRDCCLETSNFWCDSQPSDLDKRCAAVVSESDCSYCPSGYEDRSNRPPGVCEDMCGDDTDNDCPAGCSRYNDKDCCDEENDNNFWCENVPRGGLNTCKSSIIPEECDLCAGGWKSEGSDYTCPKAQQQIEDVLKSRYRVKAVFKFIDDGERKAAKIYVNGYQFYLDTTGDDYSRYIDNYVESGTNAIKIEPDQTVLDIRKLTVEIEE